MGGERARRSASGARYRVWDSLPWKAIEADLEKDSGWNANKQDEQSVLYSLEEISGEEYMLKKNSLGGSQMVSAPTDPVPAIPAPTLAPTVLPTDLDSKKVLGCGGGEVELNGGEIPTPSADKKKRNKRKKKRSVAVGGEGGMQVGAREEKGEVSQKLEGHAITTDRSEETVPGTEGRGVGLVLIAGEEKSEAVGSMKTSADISEGGGGGSNGSITSNVGRGEASKDETETEAEVLPGKMRKRKKRKKSAKKTEQKGEMGRDEEDGGDDGRKESQKKQKKDPTLNVAGGGDGSALEGGGRGQQWELSPEDSVKMLPWTYLGVELHPALLFHLHRQGFYQPTPIQKRVLPKALLGRKDIIGAAETGSGKTLAYGLPVLNELLFRAQAKAEEKEGMADDNTLPVKEAGGQGVSGKKGESGEGGEPLQALVLCPTRELALQVCAHLKEVIKGTGLAVVAVVGGLAEVKQERQLARRPEVVVATPGRLWELSSSNAHLGMLGSLRHLVVDEADRMLERGHFPELERLFTLLGVGKEVTKKDKGLIRGNIPSLSSDEETEDDGGGMRGGGRIGGDRNGVMGQQRGVLERRRKGRGRGRVKDDGTGSNMVGDFVMGRGEVKGMDSEFMAMDAEEEVDEEGITAELEVVGGGEGGDPCTTPSAVSGTPRQTFVFSATLTLGSKGRRVKGRGKKKGKAGGGKELVEENPVGKVMARVGLRGQPVVIDVGRRTVSDGTEGIGDDMELGGVTGVEAGEGGEVFKAPSPALPSKLRLCSIKSLQMDKDVYAYLFCTLYPGRTLIFVNAIACARRVVSLLVLLNVPATPLHAQMQQRQRLKSLDRFTSDNRAVLVATDVAARGLDIPKVEHVVHYDAARSAEVYIHRSGRTARASASGLSLSIVAPRDVSSHKEICSVLGLGYGGVGSMDAFPLDNRLVDRARERVGLAVQVLKFQEYQNRTSATKDFFRGLSRDADLIMDENLLDATQEVDDGGGGGRVGRGGKSGRQAARMAAEAKGALEACLCRPLHTDRRKILPVAQTIMDMKLESQRTAVGDLRGSRRKG